MKEFTQQELEDIAEYTIRKIESYPKEYGLNADNYFDILFPDVARQFALKNEFDGKQKERKVEPCVASA